SNCGTLRPGRACQFAPSSPPLSNGQAATTLIITASRTFMSYAAPTGHIPGRGFPLWATFASGLFGLVTLEGASQRKRRQTTIARDRKSTRLNSSHLVISYAVF